MSLQMAIITTFLCAVIVIFTRAFPFLLFSNRKSPKIINFFEKYLPPFVMLGLLIYSLRTTNFDKLLNWVPQTSAIFFCILTYLWKKNTLISIFGATTIYMILIRIL